MNTIWKEKKNGWTVIMININRSKSQETRKKKKETIRVNDYWLYNKKKKKRGKIQRK